MSTPTSFVTNGTAFPLQGLLGRLSKFLLTAENSLLSLVIGGMMLLPLLEILLRQFDSTGIQGSTPIVQHLTLVVGTLGAAVAARENRLLSLSTSVLLAKKGLVSAIRLFSSAIAASVCVFLAISSIEFIQAERLGENILAYGIPIWVVQLVLPTAFTLIAIRLILNGSARRIQRLLVAGLVIAITLTLGLAPIPAESIVLTGVVILLIATVFGAPIFVTLGGISLVLFWGQATPIAVVALDHYQLVVNPSLPAIPLFTVAGYLLAESGAPTRLIRVFNSLFGRFHGGAAIATVLVCTFFTSFTGASGVTILALGGLLMPLLLSNGHSRRSALGLITGGGSPGVLLLPALPLILYAVVANIEITQMFKGALLPVLLMFAITATWGFFNSQRQVKVQKSFSWHEARSAIIAAKWELLLPVVPIASLFGGLATPVEAAALTAFYTFFVETVIHRDLKLLSDIPRLFSNAGMVVGGILLILGVALGFTNFLIDAQIHDQALAWITGFTDSRWTFLLMLNVFLLIVGCVMDIYTAIVVLAPLIIPMGMAFGINPVHLGVIFLANLELGFLTPPVGLNLFFASSRFNTSMNEVYRSVIPLFIALCAGVLVITYVPWLSS